MADPTNPFRFGALALDEAFTDREEEVAELRSDIRNGQDVVIFAPRRYGKSSLVVRVQQDVIRRGVLVAYCDLSRSPTKERFAAKLAETIHDHVASRLYRARDRALGVFRGLRIQPVIQVDPMTSAVSFSFQGARRQEADLDETIERLLELPATLAAERKRKVALVFDEFQEVTELDANFPKLMRSVFQAQPEVAHVYLGSKRHLMERIFNDANEPFWRSAKEVEIGVIAPELFASYIREQFQRTRKHVEEAAVTRMLELTGGHPYGTQQIAYFAWEEVGPRGTATEAHVERAVDAVLAAEHRHFSLLWDDATQNERMLLLALAQAPGRPYSEEYRNRYDLPADTNVQRALSGLVREELVAKDAEGRYGIVEPFLAEWLMRRQL